MSDAALSPADAAVVAEVWYGLAFSRCVRLQNKSVIDSFRLGGVPVHLEGGDKPPCAQCLTEIASQSAPLVALVVVARAETADERAMRRDAANDAAMYADAKIDEEEKVSKLEDALAAVTREREALVKYAWHHEDCPFLQDTLPCTCGLDAALRAAGGDDGK